MIDTVLNLLFNCRHRHLTRPITPVSKTGVAQGETYVVCLDCAKQFAYDLNTMQIGKAVDHAHEACVVPPRMPGMRKTKMKYAVGIGVPLAVLIGSAFARRKPKQGKNPEDNTKAGPGTGADTPRARSAGSAS